MLLADDFGDEDVVAFRDVDAWIRVESAAGRHTTYARSCGAPFHGEIAAAAQLALHFDEVILRAFERGLDGVLFGMVGAEARAQQFVHAFEIGLDYGRFAAGDAPSDAPSGGEVILGESAEGNHGDIGRDRGHGDVGVVVRLFPVGVVVRLFPVNDEFVVNFVGKNDQVVTARQVPNLLEHFSRAN